MRRELLQMLAAHAGGGAPTTFEGASARPSPLPLLACDPNSLLVATTLLWPRARWEAPGEWQRLLLLTYAIAAAQLVALTDPPTPSAPTPSASACPGGGGAAAGGGGAVVGLVAVAGVSVAGVPEPLATGAAAGAAAGGAASSDAPLGLGRSDWVTQMRALRGAGASGGAMTWEGLLPFRFGELPRLQDEVSGL